MVLKEKKMEQVGAGGWSEMIIESSSSQDACAAAYLDWCSSGLWV